MDAVIHIGLPKCGSTSIQSWLRLNGKALEGEGVRMIGGNPTQLLWASIHVALRELGVDEESAWRHLDWQRKSMSGAIHGIYEDLSGRFEQMKAVSGVFVLSQELLFMRNEINIISIDKFLAKFFENRTYVVYIRDTIDLFVSTYSEVLRMRNRRLITLEFQKFLKKCVDNPRKRHEENYFDQLFVWERLVGRKLNVRLLESNWLTNGNLIEDFSSLIGVGPFCMPLRENESFAAEYVEYVRFLNRKMEDAYSARIRGKAIETLKASSAGQSMDARALRFHALEILRAASAGKPKLSVSDEQAKSIRKHFHEKEEKIRKRFFPDRPFLFSPKPCCEGLMPLPLTNRRMVEIETEIREKMTPMDWESYNLALRNGSDGRVHAATETDIGSASLFRNAS